MAQPRCFVISPIGAPGSAEREHADDVFDYIIRPACEDLGYRVMRADHDTRPGIITDQMYDSILGDDLLIAVLSGHNPNVFYELAIAEAAARPLILMIQTGDSIPFDIKDRRILHYDLRPRALMDGTHSAALKLAIFDTQAAIATGKTAVVPFRPGLTPLGASGGGMKVLSRTNYLDPEDRLNQINQSADFVRFRGLSLFNLPARDRLHQCVRAAMARGVRIEVLLMSPDNPALESQLREFVGTYVSQIRMEIEAGIEVWSKLVSGSGTVSVQTKGMMSGMAQISEKTAILTPYSLATPTADSPIMTTPAGSPFYVAAIEEFEFVWAGCAKPI